MGILQELLKDIPVPKMAKVKVKFDDAKIDNLDFVLMEKLQREQVVKSIKPGMEIAVAVGSRGLDRIIELTAATVKFLKSLGAKPFIVPSMGSHGGATAEGQRAVLEHLGITKEAVGAEIRSSMEVVEVGRLANGLPVYVDKFALQADGIVVINRVKPHTAFRGPVESGIMKMISIGLGKQKGAEACHQMGFKHMAENVPAMAKVIMEKTPFLFGVATVENAFDKIAIVEVLTPDEVIAKEPDLQKKAKSLLPKLFFDQLDVLVIDEIGKNISGDGMDPNITGRYPTPYATGGPDVNKMVVLDVTPQSEGNANGVGTADFTTQRLLDKMDREGTYANGLTSTVVAPTKIATTLPNDKMAFQAAVKTCNILNFNDVKLVRIKNTLVLSEIEVSEGLLEYVRSHPNMEQITDLNEISFDEKGNLF
ncbi:lactate racemase domain-containing protein [Niallia taxi]|uniref:lactate racemase domain-containing protein n=1 Tax=Niallia taxi TaxID=2499688 RepID=UPI0025511704|nr:lactate racemase domain-containing protein [Niallia taxi]MDK8642256.1 lactate racemase domain-containing protein [Niallia taxi]MED4055241.1 lactate racemase domain-containing protein [Niallia taxi]MED4120736.1 lactate racemase domain-containing protein [Niallia taxi]